MQEAMEKTMQRQEERQWRSTNGRYGVKMLVPTDQQFPAEGELVPLGRKAGYTCFQFNPGKTGVWITIHSGSRPVAGMSTVIDLDLQSSDSIQVYTARPGAVMQWFGYKGRESGFRVLKAGRWVDCPTSVLLATGLVEPEQTPEPVPDPEPFNSAFADALKKAGVI